jgi:hypothetical protein
MKFEMTCQHYNYFGLADRQPGTKINIQFEGESLDEILEEFAMFLRGCGFSINGTLDIVPDEEFYGTNTGTNISVD